MTNKAHLELPNFFELDKRKKVNQSGTKPRPIEEQVVESIRRDLERLNWKFQLPKKKGEFPTIVPPEDYDQSTIRRSMAYKRDEIIATQRGWINENTELARSNLGNGTDVINSEIVPSIELCESEEQKRIFKIFRYYWSSPYSEYVGRRMKLIIRDSGLRNRPVIGIAALGSPIIHIPERDDFIGWDKEIRTQNLIYTMDAYVLGALPPYNHLLGGKLVSYILASREVRELYRRKYKDQITLKERRKANKLVGIFTTSLFGRSSQYNRIKFLNETLYHSIGQTKGFGSLHLSDETVQLMIQLIKSRGIDVGNNFGDGPSWVMRVIRCAGDILGFDGDFLLKHSFKRNIYFLPLAKNFKAFLNNETKQPKFYNYSKDELTEYWKERWFRNRKQNLEVVNKVINFKSANFNIE